ncbi:hypothetical protein RGQ13_13680 [Thalassotalea psychrophila]|uniref:Carboxypeptidase regulatory-like domain-containing protein n=1 Tax=Thalassotalea psychrophila TaxID=3065647 RepID=A0ABY9TRW9_9GAMM|nr:hypothetical protein RGQ13_13680 [Colwelliaceae bacterium SQ149]
MLTTKLKKLSGLMLLGASLTLTGCDLFDNDSDDSPSGTLATFSGNALKGVLANADVNLYHYTDITNAVLSTTTDENGDYELSGLLDDAGVYLISVTANDNTTMLCDVENCGTADAPIAFGETVPSASLAGVELSNVTYVDDAEEAVTVNAQVNAVTSIATELYVSNLETTNPDLGAITADDFTASQTAVTKTVAAIFGVEVTAHTNVFTLELPNLNDPEETAAADASESGFAIINAAVTTSTSDNIAESIATIVETAVVLTETDSSDPAYQEAASAWEDVQADVMAEAVVVSQNPEITLSEEAAEAVTEIEDAANEGVDLEEIEDAVEDAEDTVGNPTGGESGGA